MNSISTQHSPASALTPSANTQVMDLLVAQQSCTPDQAGRLMTRPGLQHSGRRPLDPQRLTPLNSALGPPSNPQHPLGPPLGDVGPNASYPLSSDYLRSQLLGPGAQHRPMRRWPGLQAPLPQQQQQQQQQIQQQQQPQALQPRLEAQAGPYAAAAAAPVPQGTSPHPHSAAAFPEGALLTQQGPVHAPQPHKALPHKVPSQGFR